MPSDFEIDTAFTRLKEVMMGYSQAATLQLAQEGYASPFEQLISCIISIRTYDEVSLPVSRQLFAKATSKTMRALSVAKIEQLILRSTCAERKAQQIWAIAQNVSENHDGQLPCDEALTLGFKGVGRKCTHLALGIACQKHLHRAAVSV